MPANDVMVGSNASRHLRSALIQVAAAIASQRLAEASAALLRRANFNPAQPRVPRGQPEGGQWTDDPHLIPVQSRPPARRSVRIGNQNVPLTAAQSYRLDAATLAARAAVDQVRAVEPGWRGPSSLTAPNSVEGLIAHLRAVEVAALARHRALTGTGAGHNGPPTKLLRDVLSLNRPAIPAEALRDNAPYRPLGFADERVYFATVKNAYHDLEDAGHPNAWLVMRGSLNTGFRFTRRLLFDTGKKSDVDLAIVDAQLFEQARSLGVEIRGGGRTAPILSDQLRPLGLEPALVRIQAAMGRPDVSFMIFKDWGSVIKRGEYRILP